jgi:hypothetical protein
MTCLLQEAFAQCDDIGYPTDMRFVTICQHPNAHVINSPILKTFVQLNPKRFIKFRQESVKMITWKGPVISPMLIG